MKSVLVLALSFAGSMAFGSHTVCSSPDFYYSSLRYDYGTAPRPGAPLGHLTVVSKGEVLVRQEFVHGLGGYLLPKYEVTFSGPTEVLHREGNETAGSKIYRDVAVLSTVRPFAPAEVRRTPVVCESTWAFVP